MNYEERVICYIDILGFKEHVDKSMKDEEYIETISVALNTINDVMNMGAENAQYRDIDAKVTQFSDCIVLSYTIQSNDQLAFIIMSISDMITSLLRDGFLLRGSITQGEVVHTDKQLFGPAMNEAYKLESKYASYPRIIVPRKVFRKAKFSSEVGNMAKERIRDYCVMDDDGWYYIDYVCSERYSSASNIIRHIQMLCGIIDDNIETSEKSILKKYSWLNTKLSHELTWAKDTYTDMSKKELELFTALRKQIKKFDTALNYSF